MADCAVIALTAFEFESDDLLILELGDDFGLHASPGDMRGTKGDLVTVDNKEHIAE